MCGVLYSAQVCIVRIAKSGWCHCHWPQVKIATIDGLVSPLLLCIIIIIGIIIVIIIIGIIIVVIIWSPLFLCIIRIIIIGIQSLQHIFFGELLLPGLSTLR